MQKRNRFKYKVFYWLSKLRYFLRSQIIVINSQLRKSTLKIKKNCSILFNEADINKSSIKISGRSHAQISGELYNCSIEINGSTNNLLIETDCILRNLTLVIKGNHCKITIKRQTGCNGGCIICMGRANYVHIGESCMLANNIDIWASDTHPIFNDNHELINHSKPIEIGNHVWLGRHTKVLKGVTIGDGAIIGMGSIITKNIPPNSLNVGIPSKCIRRDITWDKRSIAEFE